jgi:hypothetical protein
MFDSAPPGRTASKAERIASVATLRKAAAGGSLLVVLIVIAVLFGCSGNDAKPALAITRRDGSVVETDGPLRAWCGIPRLQGDTGRSLHILEGERAFANSDDVPSYWIFRVELERLDQTTRFAVPQVPMDTRSWVFFVYDAERENEAAAYKEGSLGSIEVRRWGCEKGDAVTLSVNARVASEIGGDAVQARGTVTAEIGHEPEGYSR